MPSHLRIQASFEPLAAQTTYRTSSASPPAKKQKMSLTQTYYVASSARTKLGREANRPDHNLRILVGHANLLDNLMVDLANAEREQEAWFDQSVQTASKPEEPRHVQWIESIAEEVEEEDSDAESDDDDSDTYDEDTEMFSMMPTIKRMRSPPAAPSSMDVDDEDVEDYDDEDDEEHTLTRVASQYSPPELMHDADSDSEDDSMPPSPEAEPELQYCEKDRQTIAAAGFYDAKPQQRVDDYSPQALIPAY